MDTLQFITGLLMVVVGILMIFGGIGGVLYYLYKQIK